MFPIQAAQVFGCNKELLQESQNPLSCSKLKDSLYIQHSGVISTEFTTLSKKDPFIKNCIRKLIQFIVFSRPRWTGTRLRQCANFIRGLLHFTPDFATFNSTINYLIQRLLYLPSAANDNQADSSCTVPQLIDEFINEKTSPQSLLFICRSQIIRTLISSARVLNLKEAVEIFKSNGDLPVILADFLLLQGKYAFNSEA